MGANENKKPGPKARKYVFGFLDETGLLHSPETDAVFGLGLIVLHHPSMLHRAILNYRNKIRYFDEFKFEKVSLQNIRIYKGLFDAFFRCQNSKFYSVLYDKRKLDIGKIYRGNHEKAYNCFVSRLIAHSLDISEYIVVLADDVSTKKNDNFEKEIKLRIKRKARRNALFGICRLESHAVGEIQMTDVLLGTIAYAFKIKYGIIAPSKNSAKLMLVKYLQQLLGIKILSESFTKKMRGGSRFGVEEYFG